MPAGLPTTSGTARIDPAVWQVPQGRASEPRYDRSPFQTTRTASTSATPTTSAPQKAAARGGGRGRKSKGTLAAEKAARDAWLAPRRAREELARAQNGGSSSSTAAELEEDGVAFMGEQSREERDVRGRAQALNIDDSDSENEALVGGGVAALQPLCTMGLPAQ